MIELKKEFIENIKGILKDEYDDFILALNKPFKKSIRFNPLKLNEFPQKNTFIEQKFNYLDYVEWDKNAFYINDDLDLSRHVYYLSGLYYFQEASALAPVNYLPLKKGMKVLDLCAAPGGKTLQIANKIYSQKNCGFLLSNDISVSRQKITLKNVEKFGLPNVFLSAESPKNIAKNYYNYFDAILIDAPCSGEGMFAKDKKTLEAWNEECNNFYSQKQLEILKQIEPALKEGGYIMYSTCTFSDVENEGTILKFLNSCKNMQIVPIEEKIFSDSLGELYGAKRIWPHKQNGLGHFMALMQKKYLINASNTEKKTKEVNSKENAKNREKLELAKTLFFDFCKSLGLNLIKAFGKDNIEEISEKLRLYSDKLYFVTDIKVPEKSFRILRNGLLIGEIKHDKFNPSQAFAMNVFFENIEQKINFSSDDINLKKYLKGESISIATLNNCDTNYLIKGYVLLFVDELPISWAFNNGKRLKNKFKRDWII